MAQRAKTAKGSAGDKRRERLATELRSNLAKRKQQARPRRGGGAGEDALRRGPAGRVSGAPRCVGCMPCVAHEDEATRESQHTWIA